MLYLGSPLAGTAGYALANARARSVHRLPVDNALSAYDVELKVRYLLHTALWGHPFEEHGRMGAGRVHNDVETGQAVAYDEIEMDGADELADLARRLVSAQQLAAAEGILRKGCDVFRKSAIIHIFAARYHQLFSRNKHLNMR